MMIDKERNRQKACDWYHADPDGARAYKRAMYALHKDSIQDRRRRRYANDPAYRERRLAQNRQSYANTRILNEGE